MSEMPKKKGKNFANSKLLCIFAPANNNELMNTKVMKQTDIVI